MTEDSGVGDSASPPALKRVNHVLLILALLSAGWSIYGTTINVNGFRALGPLFAESNIILPGMAILFTEHQVFLDVLRIVLAGTCVYFTARDADRGRTAYLNAAGIVVPLLIWIVQLMAFYNTIGLDLHIRLMLRKSF